MTGAALPNFCRWMTERHGYAWTLPPERFREEKREYERLLGCKVYGPQYLRRFHGQAGPVVDADALVDTEDRIAAAAALMAQARALLEEQS